MKRRIPFLLVALATSGAAPAATSISELVGQANNLAPQVQDQLAQSGNGCAPAIILLGVQSAGVTGIGKLLPSNPLMVRFNQEGDRLSAHLQEARRLEEEGGKHRVEVAHCERLIGDIQRQREMLAGYQADLAKEKDAERRKSLQGWIDTANQKLAELLKEGDVEALRARADQNAQAAEQAEARRQQADAAARQQSMVVEQAYQSAEQAARACPEF